MDKVLAELVKQREKAVAALEEAKGMKDRAMKFDKQWYMNDTILQEQIAELKLVTIDSFIELIGQIDESREARNRTDRNPLAFDSTSSRSTDDIEIEDVDEIFNRFRSH